jgi:hypothetical protein
MATYAVTKEAPKTVRELIMALRKVANHDAMVFLDCGNERQFIAEVQITDMMLPTKSVVHIVGSAKEPVNSNIGGP